MQCTGFAVANVERVVALTTSKETTGLISRCYWLVNYLTTTWINFRHPFEHGLLLHEPLFKH
jgi:hypothetical protein